MLIMRFVSVLPGALLSSEYTNLLVVFPVDERPNFLRPSQVECVSLKTTDSSPYISFALIRLDFQAHAAIAMPPKQV